ncbi:ABC transporter ATP-binding protein [Cellulomonas palmilytica]|uniref:ABC transporter ATP-binding protein n=1 Tax=Cellulomonas palmilytica TaxID=2608402 RepID=UPI001F2D3366|nr:ABC transporter ATP-binding protein [Cellulomonas palmilytica]UJP40742.1 ABC transporter ATP-binding protein [Cellulomonas palmilytica]
MTSVLRALDVHKTYRTDPPLPVLAGVDLELAPGERVAVVGRSGSGKSTFLNLVGLLDTPTSGRVELLGQDTGSLSARERDRLRAHTLGFVFQEHHVLGHRTVAENLEIAASIAGTPRTQRRTLVDAALARVGLTGRQQALGRLLSGGEKQRLAVARAVLSGPRLVLADEPTGNLDPENADNVLALFDEQAAAGVAVLVITHDDRIAAWADRTVRLCAGRLEEGARR